MPYLLTEKLVEDFLCCISVATAATTSEKLLSLDSGTPSSFYPTMEEHLLEYTYIELHMDYANTRWIIIIRTCSSLSIEDDSGKPSVDLAMSVKRAIYNCVNTKYF